jgi:hypothetical protein
MKRLFLVVALTAPAASGAQALPVEPPPVRGGIFATFSPVAYAGLKSNSITQGSYRSGIGVGALLGYGLTPRFFMVGDLTVTDLTLEAGSAYHLYHAELFARPTLKPWRVGGAEVIGFLDGGGGLVMISGKRPTIGGVQKHGFSGSFISGGLGTSVFFRQTFAVTATGHVSFGLFSDETIGNVTASNYAISAFSTRATLGLSWQPKRPLTAR